MAYKARYQERNGSRRTKKTTVIGACKLQPPFLQRPHHVQRESKDFRDNHTALI